MGNDISRSSLLLTLLICFTLFAHGQTGASFQDERAKEDYSFLKDSTQLTWQDAIKFIRLDEEGNSYLSFGASLRTRFEHFTNNSWLADNNQNYYSQRITFHTDVHLGKHVRFFGELQHGYKSDGVSFLQTDDIDLHQGFIELKTSSSNPFSFRFGRQEMKLGVGRLIDLRVGPNVRRAFDMAKISFDHENVKIGAFYGNEVQIDFGAFDNDFNFFEQLTTNPKVWSINAKILTSKSTIIGRSIDVYYLGFQSTTAAFSDVVGEETRHSMGIRSYGKIGTRFQYNTELIYQFGDIGNNSISAFNIETDWKYTFINTKWRPTIGLKLDWSSGDRAVNDGKINSFNPLFVNPATYSLAAINTPVNLFSLHPSLILFPNRNLFVNIEYAFFYRSSSVDGFYSPPRIQTRMADGISEKSLGNVFGLFMKYTFSKYCAIDVRSSYFTAGSFIEQSGPSAPIFQIAPTLTFIL